MKWCDSGAGAAKIVFFKGLCSSQSANLCALEDKCMCSGGTGVCFAMENTDAVKTGFNVVMRDYLGCVWILYLIFFSVN